MAIPGNTKHWIDYVTSHGRHDTADGVAPRTRNWADAVRDKVGGPECPSENLYLTNTHGTCIYYAELTRAQLYPQIALVGRSIIVRSSFSSSAQGATLGPFIRIKSQRYQLTAAWTDLPLQRWPYVLPVPPQTRVPDIVSFSPTGRSMSGHLDYTLLPLGERQHIDNDYPSPNLINIENNPNQPETPGSWFPKQFFCTAPSSRADMPVYIVSRDGTGWKEATLNPVVKPASPQNITYEPNHQMDQLASESNGAIRTLFLHQKIAGPDPLLGVFDRGAPVIDRGGNLYGMIISSSMFGSRYAHMVTIDAILNDIKLKHQTQDVKVMYDWND
ncbi:hypothetical protein B0T17DRAFT_505841 [Bombardia bombarda]|uniref:Uncharacterized protein n=1 Tax=Bombardia bombarda TaxID=252184 RepID=A0AA39X8H0_9PEZI|nr:hypothetical protein B0T17DRAFT_505841 [Bombardia bombarda]